MFLNSLCLFYFIITPLSTERKGWSTSIRRRERFVGLSILLVYDLDCTGTFTLSLLGRLG